MFGIGLSEIVVLVFIAILLIRPEDLPTFFRKAGRFYAKVKNAYKEVAAVKDDFLREMEVGAALNESAQSAPKPAETGTKTDSAAPANTEPEQPAGEE